MNKIITALRRKPLTITELVESTGLTRSKVRIELAFMEGRGLVKVRKVGMAKLYYLEAEE